MSYEDAAALVTVGLIAEIIGVQSGKGVKSLLDATEKFDWKLFKTKGTNLDDTAHINPETFKMPDFRAEKPSIEKLFATKDVVEITKFFNNNGWNVGEDLLNKIPKELIEGSKIMPAQSIFNPTKPNLGIRFDSKNDKIRIMRGDPNANFPSQRVDYVKIVSGGEVIGKGGVVLKESKINNKPSYLPEAHISLKEWNNWKEWNKP